MLARAANHPRKMRLPAAIRAATRAKNPGAYILAIRWFLRRYYPRRVSSVVRKVIWRDTADMARCLAKNNRLNSTQQSIAG